jgi:hypothetical protein
VLFSFSSKFYALPAETPHPAAVERATAEFYKVFSVHDTQLYEERYHLQVVTSSITAFLSPPGFQGFPKTRHSFLRTFVHQVLLPVFVPTAGRKPMTHWITKLALAQRHCRLSSGRPVMRTRSACRCLLCQLELRLKQQLRDVHHRKNYAAIVRSNVLLSGFPSAFALTAHLRSCRSNGNGTSGVAGNPDERLLEPAPVWCASLEEFEPDEWRGTVDCITAGFPCQPWSTPIATLETKTSPVHSYAVLWRGMSLGFIPCAGPLFSAGFRACCRA